MEVIAHSVLPFDIDTHLNAHRTCALHTFCHNLQNEATFSIHSATIPVRTTCDVGIYPPSATKSCVSPTFDCCRPRTHVQAVIQPKTITAETSHLPSHTSLLTGHTPTSVSFSVNPSSSPYRSQISCTSQELSAPRPRLVIITGSSLYDPDNPQIATTEEKSRVSSSCCLCREKQSCNQPSLRPLS